jgi:hypothetical protein
MVTIFRHPRRFFQRITPGLLNARFHFGGRYSRTKIAGV